MELGTLVRPRELPPSMETQCYPAVIKPNLGYISSAGLGTGLRHCCTQQRRSAMKVKEVMHKGVEWVGPDTPLAEIAKLMRQHDIGSIPIGEDDKLIGMVTDRDIVCNGLAKDSFDPRRATARDVMSEGIHCCSEDDDLAKAVQHMEKLKVRRLPVINKSKRMVGIISLEIGRASCR